MYHLMHMHETKVLYYEGRNNIVIFSIIMIHKQVLTISMLKMTMYLQNIFKLETSN